MSVGGNPTSLCQSYQNTRTHTPFYPCEDLCSYLTLPVNKCKPDRVQGNLSFFFQKYNFFSKEKSFCGDQPNIPMKSSDPHQHTGTHRLKGGGGWRGESLMKWIKCMQFIQLTKGSLYADRSSLAFCSRFSQGAKHLYTLI